MIEVIDNLLTPSYCDSIYNLAKYHLSYQYSLKTSYTNEQDAPPLLYDPLVKDAGQLSCVVQDSDLRQNITFGWAYEQLKPIFYTVKDKFPELELGGSNRVKFNILLQQKEFQGFYNQPHVDVPSPTYTMVYYLNDCDGDTVIFNEKYTDNHEPLKLTVAQRVSPKKNRAVIFEADRYHASSNPVTSENRFVINWVFWK